MCFMNPSRDLTTDSKATFRVAFFFGPAFQALLLALALLAAFPPLSTDMYLPALPSLTTDWDSTETIINLTLVGAIDNLKKAANHSISPALQNVCGPFWPGRNSPASRDPSRATGLRP